jgi:hypothetical protein
MIWQARRMMLGGTAGWSSERWPDARYAPLTIRSERKVTIQRAFLLLKCALICFNFPRGGF